MFRVTPEWSVFVFCFFIIWVGNNRGFLITDRNTYVCSTFYTINFLINYYMISEIAKLTFAMSARTPLPVAARSKAWVCDCSHSEIVGSNPGGGHGWLFCFLLSGRGLCVELITRTEESYGVWWVWVCCRNLNSEKAYAQWGFRSMNKEISIRFWHFCGNLFNFLTISNLWYTLLNFQQS